MSRACEGPGLGGWESCREAVCCDMLGAFLIGNGLLLRVCQHVPSPVLSERAVHSKPTLVEHLPHART